MNGLLQVFTHSPGGATRWQLGVFDPLRASAYCAYSAVGVSGCKSSVQTTGTNALCPEGRWQSLQASCCQEHKRAEAVSPNQMSRKPAGQKTSRRINCATRETSWHHGPDSGACLPCPVPRPLRLAQQDSEWSGFPLPLRHSCRKVGGNAAQHHGRPGRPSLAGPRQALTVVGEARFAQTHYKVHFHLVRSHRLGANGALET